MSSATSKSLPYPVTAILGLAMAFGGYWVSKNVKIAALEEMAHNGILIDPGKTLATIGVLILLFPVINMFFVGPLVEAIQSRNSKLEQTFSEAETLRADMAKMKSDYEKRITDTEASAREQIQNQIRQAQEMRDQMVKETTALRDEMVKKAQQEIDQERRQALTELRLHVVDLTMNATERLLGENVDSERNRRLVNEFIDKIEVPN